MRRFAIVFIAASLIALGQSSPTNTGPTLGFVPGSVPWQLQPILGIPGAARLGNPVSLPNTVTQIYVAPGQVYAVAAQGPADPAALVILRVGGVMQTDLRLTALPGALAKPDLVAFSPTGQSMAFYSAQSGSVQVLAGMPNSPRISQRISYAGTAALLAVSDDGQAVLISDGLGNVYSLSGNNSPVPVYRTEEVAALTFIPQSHDAIVCDPYADNAAVAQAVGGVTMVPPLASPCQPQAAATTADGKTILLACPASHLIWSIDRASGSIDFHGVNSRPTGFNSLALPNTFVITPADDAGTYWLATWQNGAPVTSFIAAAPKTGAGN